MLAGFAFVALAAGTGFGARMGLGLAQALVRLQGLLQELPLFLLALSFPLPLRFLFLLLAFLVLLPGFLALQVWSLHSLPLCLLLLLQGFLALQVWGMVHHRDHHLGAQEVPEVLVALRSWGLGPLEPACCWHKNWTFAENISQAASNIDIVAKIRKPCFQALEGLSWESW